LPFFETDALLRFETDSPDDFCDTDDALRSRGRDLLRMLRDLLRGRDLRSRACDALLDIFRPGCVNRAAAESDEAADEEGGG